MNNAETSSQNISTETNDINSFAQNLFLGINGTGEDYLQKIKKEAFVEINKLSEKYDYVILTTRRCFCMFEAMTEEFGKDFFSLENIISSQKIDIIGNDFQEKNVILVDDVMIHGSAVLSLYEKIKNNYGAANVDTFVFIRNIEFPDYYKFKTNKKYDTMLYNIPWEWRQISNEFIKYIHSMRKLYVSYLYGYIVNSAELTSCIKNLLSKGEIKHIDVDFGDIIKHKIFDNNNLPEYYVFNKNLEFVKNSALRVYKYYGTEAERQLIPYVELKDFYADNLDDIWVSIWKNSVVPDEMKVIKTSEDKYKALTSIVSLFLYRKLFYPKKNVSEIPIKVMDYIDKSYFNGFIDIIKFNVKDNAIDIISKKYIELDVNKDYNSINESIMIECLSSLEPLCSVDSDKYDEIKKIVLKYIHEVTQKEDEYFSNKILNGIDDQEVLTKDNIDKKYVTPIFTTLLYQKIPKELFDEIYVTLLFLLDCGVLSHIVKKINNIVGTCEKTGEQSYHLFSDLSGNAFKAIYFILSSINNTASLKRERFKKKILEKLDECADDCLEKYKDIIIHFVKNQPLNYKADYFGILQLRNNDLNNEDKIEESAIMKKVGEIVNSI